MQTVIDTNRLDRRFRLCCDQEVDNGLTSPFEFGSCTVKSRTAVDTTEIIPILFPASSMETSSSPKNRQHFQHHQQLPASVPPISQYDSDADSRDEGPHQLPLHHQHSASAASRTADEIFRLKPESPSTVVPSTTSQHRLTLSAFRRPEFTVRLTQCDPARTLECDYDLYAQRCGVLGHGAFSTVRLAVRRRDGTHVAVKSIAKHEALRSRRLRLGGRTYMEEWEILRRFIHHPHIVTLLDVYETDDEVQIVTEYCRGGELFDSIQKRKIRSQSLLRGQYSENKAARVTGQILRALKELHAQNIVHRDLKPENILLVGPDDASTIHVKLCDFGMARALCPNDSESSSHDGDTSPLTPRRSRSFSTLGSDYYVAPEVCFGGNYDTSVDIYSLGVTLYILLCGFPPVFTADESCNVIFPGLYWNEISDSAKNLVLKMLAPDPADRISAQDALEDIWIVRCERTPLMTAAALPQNRYPPQLDLQLVQSRLFSSLMAATALSGLAGASTPSKVSTSSSLSSSSCSSNTINKKRGYTTMRATSPAAATPFAASATGSSHNINNSNNNCTTSKKRSRFERRASIELMALADLYRGVAATPSVRAMAAAAAASTPNNNNKNNSPSTTATPPPPPSECCASSFTDSPIQAVRV